MELTDASIEMTSWIASSIPKKKVAPMPSSYFLQNEGTFAARTPKLMFVSAVYELTPGLTDALREMPWPTLIFTESKLADTIAAARDGMETLTRVVVLERNEWISTTKMVSGFWTQQVKQDPEIRLGRTAEDLQYMFERKEFMKKAVELNPFGSTDFVWVHPSHLSSVAKIDSLNPTPRIPVDRLLVANPDAFTADDIASSYFRGKQRVENGILIGPGRAWNDFHKLYDTVMVEKLKTGGFIGDDAVMLHYMIIHKPNQFSLVKTNSLTSILT